MREGGVISGADTAVCVRIAAASSVAAAAIKRSCDSATIRWP